ncbi:ATP-dependent helicase [Defluviimonas salinarum]|uniref:DNA 3'-5' helicase n=1 Tax=Defluviimonas salinarum TaxID=2992147 RepID=A0ABT3J4K1_9RHOB|nr:ATP-dependent helicase [Defluviimonas salinarum]MCW3782598.1 ATP-dependent helicase [Defluviimonas salinarum]
MSSDPIEFIRSMSGEQRAAALQTADPVMIIAGAGSGKTRTLVGRFIHMLSPVSAGGLGADPSSIMMVTFTNKAAREMRERIAPVLEGFRARDPQMQGGEPWIGTFHGLSLRILRIEAAKAGLGKNFSIFDEADAAGLAKEVAEGLDLDSFDVDEFFRDLEIAKARLLSADLLAAKRYDIHAARLAGEGLSPTLRSWEKILSKFETPDFTRVYSAYQRALAEQNAVDFSDLMNRVTKLFQENEEVRNSWRSSFRHFMIDEVQDINRAQVAWLDALTDGGRPMVIPEGAADNNYANAGDGLHEVNTYRVRRFPRPTVAFVGDDDQSIYAFRGSDPSVMRSLRDRYPGLDVKFLRASYRCQPSILTVANTLVANNTGRYDKELEPADPFRERRKVLIEEHVTPADEIRRLAAEAAAHIANGGDPSQFAVLTRTRDLAKAVARELRAAGLPVSEGKASDIRKTAEVRDAMAFAGFIVNPDAEVYLRRIINKPARGLGPTSTGRVGANARAKGTSFGEELRTIIRDRIVIPEGGEPYKTAFIRNVKQFGHLIGQMRDDAAQAPDAAAAIVAILERSGYLPEMRKDALSSAGLRDVPFRDAPPREFLSELIRASSEKKSGKEVDAADLDPEDLADRAGQLSEASRRIGNIAILLEQASKFPSLEAFMQEATLEMDQSEAAAGIQVMTTHASKGLEFDKVRLPFWMEGIVPHSRALEEGDASIEEERRLAYVALTRAREDVRISRSWNINGCPFIRMKRSYPSRFIEEIRRAPRAAFELASIRNRDHRVYRVSDIPAGLKPRTARPEPDVRQAGAGSQQMRSILEVSPAHQPVAAAPAMPVVAAQEASLPDQRSHPVLVPDFDPDWDAPVPDDPLEAPFAPISDEEFEHMSSQDFGDAPHGDMIPEHYFNPDMAARDDDRDREPEFGF